PRRDTAGTGHTDDGITLGIRHRTIGPRHRDEWHHVDQRQGFSVVSELLKIPQNIFVVDTGSLGKLPKRGFVFSLQARLFSELLVTLAEVFVFMRATPTGPTVAAISWHRALVGTSLSSVRRRRLRGYQAETVIWFATDSPTVIALLKTLTLRTMARFVITNKKIRLLMITASPCRSVSHLRPTGDELRIGPRPLVVQAPRNLS